MTNTPRDWESLHERIAAEWQEARRDGADRKTQVARVKAARARRAAALTEARVKAAVDKAVQEALARPEFAEAVDQLTATAAAPAPYLPPAKPLHTLTTDELREEGKAYWESRQPAPYRPLTIGELTAGYDADQA